MANRAHRASGKDMNEFKYDWSRDLADIAEQIAAEKTPQVRRLLMMGYLRMGQFGALGLDKKIAEQVLAEVPLNSPLWSLSPMLLRFSVDQAGQGNSFDEYLLRFLDQHPDKILKATLLFNEAMSAKFRNVTAMFAVMSYQTQTEEILRSVGGRLWRYSACADGQGASLA